MNELDPAHPDFEAIIAILTRAAEIDLPGELGDFTRLATIIMSGVARVERDGMEGREADREEAAREIANLILSCIRWVPRLGVSLLAALTAALASQEAYAEKLAREKD